MPTTVGHRGIAVVTGASRGLGLETCRQLASHGFRVVLTARDPGAARFAAERLGVHHTQLDVTDRASIERAATDLGARFGRIDVLVQNAGIAMEGFDAHVARTTLGVNLFGVMAVTDALRSVLSEHATIVMVSSGLGALSCLSPARRQDFDDPSLSRDRLLELMHEFIRDVENDTYEVNGWPRSAYRVSKVGLNAFTRILAREVEGSGIRVNAVCPGWVRTDMGGSSATRSVEEGARGIVWAATLPREGPSGKLFHDEALTPW